MFRKFDSKYKLLLISGLVILFGAIGIFLTVKTNSQRLQVANQNEKNALIEKIKASADYPLRFLENEDSPLRITETKVKEITGSEFTRLTDKTTNLITVSSFPEVKLHNSSGKTIIGFALLIRDPQTRTSRTMNQSKVSIAPGAIYTVEREHFIAPDKQTVSDDKGVRQEITLPQMDSEKYWIDFAGRSDIFIIVGLVYFEDGSSWMVKEGGEIK